MNRIWVGIQFEGDYDPEELFSCIEEALVQFRDRGMPFATTAGDEPIVITAWNPEWVGEEK